MRKTTRSIIRAIFWFLLGGAFILYVTYYDQLQGLLLLIRNIAPSIIFIVGTILIVDHYQEEIKLRRRQGEEEEVIYITYMDAMKNDLLAFFTAALILFVPFVFGENLNAVDIIQAIIALVAIMYIRHYYFKKIRG